MACSKTYVKLRRAQYERAMRPIMYGLANTLLLSHVTLQRHYGLRSEEFQVLLVIIVATVQRFARTANPDPRYLTDAPLPPELASSISRRRIADALDIPIETTRRHVRMLIDRGIVVERRRGQLSTAGGTLAGLNRDGVADEVLKHFVQLASEMASFGALCGRVAPEG